MYLHLVVSKLHGYYAEVPGLLAPDSSSNFILGLFFSDRPTQNQKTNSEINENKKTVMAYGGPRY